MGAFPGMGGPYLMGEYIAPLEKLIEQFRSLKGVGRKTATRLAFSILDFKKNRFSILLILFCLPSILFRNVSVALISAKRITVPYAPMNGEIAV